MYSGLGFPCPFPCPCPACHHASAGGCGVDMQWWQVHRRPKISNVTRPRSQIGHLPVAVISAETTICSPLSVFVENLGVGGELESTLQASVAGGAQGHPPSGALRCHPSPPPLVSPPQDSTHPAFMKHPRPGTPLWQLTRYTSHLHLCGGDSMKTCNLWRQMVFGQGSDAKPPKGMPAHMNVAMRHSE